MSDYSYTEYRRPLWPMLVAFGAVGGLAIVLGVAAYLASGAGANHLSGGAGDAGREMPANAAAERMDSSAAHQIVMDFYRDSANDPKSLEFARWGPDDLRGEIKADYLKAVNGKAPVNSNSPGSFFGQADQIVRVRVRAKNDKGALALQDVLVAIHAGKVVKAMENPAGDEWIDRFRAGYK